MVRLSLGLRTVAGTSKRGLFTELLFVDMLMQPGKRSSTPGPTRSYWLSWCETQSARCSTPLRIENGPYT